MNPVSNYSSKILAPIAEELTWTLVETELTHFLEQIRKEKLCWKDEDLTILSNMEMKLSTTILNLPYLYRTPELAYRDWENKIEEFIEGPALAYDLIPLPSEPELKAPSLIPATRWQRLQPKRRSHSKFNFRY